ncbi:MAG TPA: hypothetical protein EYQ83_02475, partial [Acidobacteria bacterium]|nr:hypothetical protein [Acidobacteriota bacterium]
LQRCARGRRCCRVSCALLSVGRADLQRARERPVFQLPSAEVSIETRTRQLMERLSGVDACNFDDLFDDDRSRGDLVTTFLALLEMIRLKMIRVFQSASFGPIRVYPRDRPDDAEEAGGDGREPMISLT